MGSLSENDRKGEDGMPKTAGQKTRIIEVYRYLLRESDENHPVTVQAIMRHLSALGCETNRKTVLDDLSALSDAGFDLIVNRGRGGGCFLASRTFEEAELRLLVDAVQFSRFIPAEKSRQIISKLLSVASVYEEKRLDREVYVSGRVRSSNRDLLRTVDAIHSAIISDRKISFLYFEWTAEHAKRLRHGGRRYVVSPCLLSWDSEYYYLFAYDGEDRMCKHFRVDKITGIREEEGPREGREEWESIVADPGKYENMLFGMHSGREESVTLSVHRDLAGIIIDRFGEGLPFQSDGKDADTFRVTVRVVVSPVFLSWVIGFGERMRILSPDSVREEALALARGFLFANQTPSEPNPEGDKR